MSYPLVRCCDIVKKYGSKKSAPEVLKGISLDVHAGEIVGLLGPNGAGKTTLSEIIASLHPLTRGDVLFKGVSIYKDIAAYRSVIGFCPQSSYPDASLTIEQHLTYAGRYYGMDAAQICVRVAELIKQFGLEQYRNQSPTVLSGGYRQRLVLARALVHKPELIILDEPTVGMDPHVRRQLWEEIRQLRDQGIAIILTTHYLDEVEYLSDRVVVLDKGLIRMVATPQELMGTFSKARLEDVFIELMNQKNTPQQ